MKEIAYHFRVLVEDLDGKLTVEPNIIHEADSKIGSAIATGKVYRLYEQLKTDSKIKDYRILV